MNSTAIKIDLIREKQQFCAAVAVTKGTLKTGQVLLNNLHPKEQTIYQRYQYDRRKESYLLGRISAKTAIMKLTGITNPKSIWIDSGVFQFPIVKGSSIQNTQVSISHCDYIGFSIAYPEDHPMGIDVEKISLDKTDVILSQLTDNEQTLLKNYFFEAKYTAIFSIKEALSKVIRTGMMLDFKFMEVDNIQLDENLLTCTFTHFGQYKAYAYRTNNYVFSIVLPKRTKENLKLVLRKLAEEF